MTVSLHNIQDLLKINRVPTDAEEDLLKKFVSDNDAKIDAITSKISESKAQLAALYFERKVLADAVRPYRAALSPFRRLPQDVVLEIFKACLETSRYPAMSNREAPVLLTQICSGMRRLALATPALWAKINICIIGDVPRDYLPEAVLAMRKRAEGVREWLLRRSGNLPLSISVYAPAYSCVPNISQEVVDVLVSCRARWRGLFLSCPPEIIAPIAAVPAAEAPLLCAISFKPFDDMEIEPRPDVWEGSQLLGAENLQQIIFLGNMQRSTRMSNYPVKWANITHAVLAQPETIRGSNYRSDGGLAHVLRHAPNLTICHLTLSHLGRLLNKIDDICLPRLRVLVVTERKSGGRTLLERLCAPALEAVSYNMDTEVTKMPTSLIVMLARSPSVREFSIHGSALNRNFVMECIRHLPLLSSLYIGMESPAWGTKWPNGDELLEALAPGNAQECVCPRLEYFRCHFPMQISRQALRDFLARKDGTDAHAALRCWREVVLVVQLAPAEEGMADEPWAEVVNSKTKLKLNFVSHKAYRAPWRDRRTTSVFTGSSDEWRRELGERTIQRSYIDYA